MMCFTEGNEEFPSDKKVEGLEGNSSFPSDKKAEGLEGNEEFPSERKKKKLKEEIVLITKCNNGSSKARFESIIFA
jgi:hypothetical protein